MLSDLTFIHAADLHLDSPFLGVSQLPETIFKRLKESTFKSVINLIDICIAKKIDFLLLSGDLFDEANRSLKAQFFLRNQFIRLETAGIHVYVIYGNHDHLSGEWTPVEWPENVHVFSAEAVEEKSYYRGTNRLASIYGSSYKKREQFDNQAADFKRSTDAKYHIAMLHGTYAGEKEHNPYSPFLLNDLIQADMDYWALGHIHKRQVISAEHPAAIYAGNLQARHQKETGEKGCYVVRLTEHEASYEFIPVADVLWLKLHVDVSDTNSVTELHGRIEEKFDSIRHKDRAVCVRLSLTGAVPEFMREAREGTFEEIVDVFREQEEEEESFVWLLGIEDHMNRQTAHTEEGLLKELTEEMDHIQLEDGMFSSLESNPFYRRYASQLNEADLMEMKAEAKVLLADQFAAFERSGGGRA
ncbi:MULTISPECIES: metallophosphoesterase family protein [Bacillus]|uniref:Metallophosphoesterase n=1 Tax=Bacillus gobiensis TaxID=1441095 RepID=A0A0M5JB25_9BACI|nr:MULTISPECIES: DNA repair exonuclease [Bacillus]ALC80607.1 metallophosphoesterase [Bacillus gobiensis]MED1094892.1 DNA repair exonuclease [Bacillus capparidis]